MSLAPLLEPIAGDNPAGVSLRGEFLYRQLELARVEEDEIPQGEWQRERKLADFPLVVRLATDVLARQSKDLQVAAWLAEAWTRREGFGGLASGLELLRELLDRYWDHVYPEVEDGDLELRAAPLEWAERNLPASIRLVPLTRAGHGLLAHRESRLVGYEDDVKADAARHAEWKAAVEAGRVSADAFDRGLADTPAAWLRERCAELDGAAATLDALAAVCDARFGDDAPRFIKLRETLGEARHLAGQFLAKRREAEPEPEPEPPAPSIDERAGAPPSAVQVPGIFAGEAASPASSSSGGTAGGGSGSTVSPTSAPAAGPLESREDAAARLAAVARWLRAARPADPAPYLMLRGFRWGELRAGGPAPDPRLLVAPPTAERVRLRTLLLDERWAQLLEAAEEVMATEYGRGWLDLQRYASAACAGLGPDYDAVRTGIAGALRSLLADVPSLPALALMDDTPAANAETRAWLRDAGITLGDAVADTPPPAPRAGAPEERARARAAAGEPERAVEILVAAAAQERSPRARFLLRARAAEVMVDAGMTDVAVPLLREMHDQVQRHTLEEWEAGDVVAHPLALLYRSLPEGAADREALYLRVCRLDPVRALQLREGAHAAA